MTNPFVERSCFKVNEDSSIILLNPNVPRLAADTSPVRWAVLAVLSVRAWGQCRGQGLWLQWALRSRGGVEEGSLVEGSMGLVVSGLLWVHPAGPMGTSRSQSWEDVGMRGQLGEIFRCETLGLKCDSSEAGSPGGYSDESGA